MSDIQCPIICHVGEAIVYCHKAYVNYVPLIVTMLLHKA